MESRTSTEAKCLAGGDEVDFVAMVDQAIALLRQRGRMTYRTLQRQFQLDDEALEDLKVELIEGQRLATDEQGTVLVWAGTPAPPPARAAAPERPTARRSAVLREVGWCWTGVAGWGTAAERAT
jgi:hypothetical protein